MDDKDKCNVDKNIDFDKKKIIQIIHGDGGALFIEKGLVVLESKSLLSGAVPNKDKADIRFSIGLKANIEEAVDYSIELLISKGYFSLDSDYWIENYNLVLVDILAPQPIENSLHYFLKRAVEEKKDLIELFEGEIEISNPLTNGQIIFQELERLLCENQKLLTVEWYAVKILKEFACDKSVRNKFLIGILWEQLRIKLSFEEQFEKNEKAKDRLKQLSPLATEALVEKSKKWKQHALKEARKILKQQPWMMGRWSELANSILDEVEVTSANSELRAIYRGKISKLKPQGSDLIGTETISKYLSGELRH